MAAKSPFPPIGFLVLGLLSLAAAIIFVVRAALVDATADRVWSAVLFAAFGVSWLAAYLSARSDSVD